jgi:hypothetical protein
LLLPLPLLLCLLLLQMQLPSSPHQLCQLSRAQLLPASAGLDQ